MNGRQNDQLFQISLILLLCAYALIGNNAINFGAGWFPSYNFSILAKEPNEVSHYTLRFHAINGEAFENPIYFNEARELLGNQDIPDGERIINRLGIAIHQSDEPAVSELHSTLIEEYFQLFDSAEYEIMLLVVNPVEKYALDSFTTEESIRLYTYSGQSEISYVGPAMIAEP
ncbi:MAG: hypothetical protein AAF633_02715 [Chloroflexota bacterium]